MARTSEGEPTTTLLNDVVEEPICPITRELPNVPVVAEDGRIYERSAIEKHFQIKKTSPVTNTPIGTKLLQSPPIKSLIDTLINKKHRESLFQAAKQGDGDAMYSIYIGYLSGKNGFEVNHEIAFDWVKKAHDAGSVKGTASLGMALLIGKSGDYTVKKNMVEGALYLGLAAERGSDYAAISLGLAYADGTRGFSKDKTRAIEWLKKSLDGSQLDASISFREKAKKKLNDLTSDDNPLTSDLAKQSDHADIS